MDACSQLGFHGMMESSWFDESVKPSATTTSNKEVFMELTMYDTVLPTWYSKD